MIFPNWDKKVDIAIYPMKLNETGIGLRTELVSNSLNKLKLGYKYFSKKSIKYVDIIRNFNLYFEKFMLIIRQVGLQVKSKIFKDK